MGASRAGGGLDHFAGGIGFVTFVGDRSVADVELTVGFGDDLEGAIEVAFDGEETGTEGGVPHGSVVSAGFSGAEEGFEIGAPASAIGDGEFADAAIPSDIDVAELTGFDIGEGVIDEFGGDIFPGEIACGGTHDHGGPPFGGFGAEAKWFGHTKVPRRYS